MQQKKTTQEEYQKCVNAVIEYINQHLGEDIDLKSLANKAGMNDKENEAAKQKLLEAMKSGMNAATFQQLEKVINNPGASGLDPEAPIYIFSSPQISGGAFVAKVSNEDDLHASLDVMAKEQICQPVSEADGYSFTTLNGNLLAFNETTAIIISASRTSQTEAAKEAITKLMKQTADNSIAKSGAFQKIAKQKSDINFFASMSAIPSTYRSQISMGLPSEIKPEDITIVGGLNFEKGKIALKTENYTENDAVKALLKKQMESFGKTSGTFVKYFPASTTSGSMTAPPRASKPSGRFRWACRTTPIWSQAKRSP